MGSGIDSQIALALMAKAKRVFEREGTFLSFPLTPYGYTREQLSLVPGDCLTPEGMRYLCEFSRLVNWIPEGIIWPPNEERYLWDIYGDVLDGRDVKLASSTRTAAEEATYQEARQLLYRETDEGLREPTPMMAAYIQCRDAYYLAEEAYRAVKGTTDEAHLRQQRDAAKSRWLTEGCRVQVEEAQQTIAMLGSKSALLSWSEWSAGFNKELDLKTDPTSHQAFAPSTYSPSNAMDTGWQRFPLSGNEADALVNQAPRELRSRLASDHVDLDIESLSFEFSSAAVVRPWMETEVFKSRIWQFTDSTKLLSDGAKPPNGMCPAYVAGVVFARNLEVKPKADSSRNTAASQRLAAGKTLSLGCFRVASAAAPAATRRIAAVGKLPVLKLATSPKLKTFSTPMHARVAPQPRPAGPSVGRAGPAVPLMTVRAVAHPAITPITARAAARGPVKAAPLNTFTFVRAVSPAATPPAPATRSQPAATTKNDDEIIILALICKELPRCPNPDASLQW